MAARYRGILFDLFGTLITFDPGRLPELRTPAGPVRSTVAALEGLLAEWARDVPAATFWQALLSVSDEMARARAYDHIELPSRERFRRALERVGCDEATQAEAAVHLSRAHMAVIVGTTVFPPAHAELLEALRPRYRLGVVSNFDDTGAAYDILLRHGITRHLDTIIVSEALGLRKPHPALLRAGMRGLGLDATDVLFVGDTFAEDVLGARAAGVDAAWIDAAGRGVPETQDPPRWVIRTLPEIATLL
jgi:putative hydrolase of the HAD superfamily